MARFNPLDPLGIYDAWKVRDNPHEQVYDYDEDLDDEDDDESTESEEEFIPYLPTNTSSRTASDAYQGGPQMFAQRYKPPLNPAVLFDGARDSSLHSAPQPMMPSTARTRNAQIAAESRARHADGVARASSSEQYIYSAAQSPTYSLLSFPPSGPSEALTSPLSSPRSSDGGPTASPLSSTLSSTPSSPHSPARIRVFSHAPPSMRQSSQSGSYSHPIDSIPSIVRLPSRAASDHVPYTPPRAHIGSISLPATPERPHGVSPYATSHSYAEMERSPHPSTVTIAPSVSRSPTQALRRRVRQWMSVFTSRSQERNALSPVAPESTPLVVHRPAARHWDAMSTTTFSTNMTSVSRRLDIDEVSQVMLLPNELDEALSVNELAGPSIATLSMRSSISGLVGPSISSVYESTIAPVGPLPNTPISSPLSNTSPRDTLARASGRRVLHDLNSHG